MEGDTEEVFSVYLHKGIKTSLTDEMACQLTEIVCQRTNADPLKRFIITPPALLQRFTVHVNKEFCIHQYSSLHQYV